MRVLITNNRLDLRGGAESLVRDLARGLQNLGHSVLAYSSDLRQRERLMENDLIPVSTDLENLPFRPDIIHGQHHLDAMTALTALPDVPAIYHCRGAVMPEAQPRHPRIYRYLARSKTLAERLAIESSLPPSRITVHRNTIDLARFQTVKEPTAKPTRGLFYNSWHRRDSATVAAITEAACQSGLKLDYIGYHFKTKIDCPETVLPAYDIVFASGRSALEAIASGCAVVVLGRTSCGGMVNTENLERLREVNFSITVNSAPPSAQRISVELRRYSAEDCAAVSKRLRVEADSTNATKELVSVYQNVIDQHRRTKPDPRAETRALTHYLREIVPLIRVADDLRRQNWEIAPEAESFEELRAELDAIEQELRESP